MRCHPKTTWISNKVAARMLIFLTRHRLPVVSRLSMYFLGCDIGLALHRLGINELGWDRKYFSGTVFSSYA
jgi:hypothetical protein